MKKIFIILTLVSMLLLSGCSSGLYNLSNFVIPDDNEFLAIIESLNTPKKICKYMENNFEYKLKLYTAYSPYQMWLANVKTKAGDCNDYSCFAVFAAHFHKIEVYQIHIFYYGEKYGHMLGVFIEGKFTYSDVWRYHNIQANTFKEVVEHHCALRDRELKYYKVYDYDMNVVNHLNY